MQDHANLTGHVLLGVLDESVERLGSRGEPLRIVNQLAPALVDIALDAVLFALEAAVFEFLMSGDQGHGARSLVQLAGLDADQAILDEVDTADALGASTSVHLFDGLQRSDVAAVDLDRDTFLELDDNLIFDRREGRVVGVGVAVLGHDVLAGALLQVRDGDGGIKTTGVGQNKAIVICHEFPFIQGPKNKLM